MSQGCKGLTRPTPTKYILRWHIVRRFLRRRNISSFRIHCCYIMVGRKFKEKHTLKQDELFCCVIINFGLKEKNVWPRWRNVDTKSFSPPWEPQTSISSSGTLDFLLPCLRINSLIIRQLLELKQSFWNLVSCLARLSLNSSKSNSVYKIITF